MKVTVLTWCVSFLPILLLVMLPVAPALALPVTLVCIVTALLVMRNISSKQAAADA